MFDTVRLAVGNRWDDFPSAVELFEKTGMQVRHSLDKAQEKHWFSLVCGRTDPVYLATRGMLTLMLHRQVERFLVVVRGTAEREAAAQALTAYVEKYAGRRERQLQVVSYTDTTELRRYVSDPTPQILLMNREYFMRPENLLLRSDERYHGQTPLSILQNAHPVVVTCSDTVKELRTLLEGAMRVQPLCILSFAAIADDTGMTMPIYVPGAVPKTVPTPTPEQMQVFE